MSNVSINDAPNGRTNLLSIALAVIILIPILSLPRPFAFTNHPWKAELGLLVFLALAMLIGFLFPVRRLQWVRRSPFPAIFTWFLCSFAAWALMTGFWAQSFTSVLHYSTVWTIYIVVFVASHTGNIGGVSIDRLFVRTALIVTLILAGLAAVDFVTIQDLSAIGTIRIRYAKYAELLLTISPALAAFAIGVRRISSKALLAAAASLAWIVVMLSLSKGAFIAGAIGFSLFFLGGFVLSSRKYRRELAIAFMVFVAVTIGTQLLFSVFTSVPNTTDYLSGKADPTRSTTEFRKYVWKVGAVMAREHWFAGVGADNFGLMFNHSRSTYNSQHPQEPATEIAEDYLVERAHNEPLQIFAETGIVGILLIAAAGSTFLIAIAIALKKSKLRMSLRFWGACGGIVGFAVSSMVSSFSFRAVQNGFVFFLVLGILAREMSKDRNFAQAARPTSRFNRPVLQIGVVCVLFILAGRLLAVAYAELEVYRAERATDPQNAQKLLVTALKFDRSYGGANLLSANLSATDKDYAAAAASMRKAIENGLGMVPTYGSLATYDSQSRDLASEEADYREGLAVFANSVYLRVRYQLFLERQDRSGEAEIQKSYAETLDKRQARGWYQLLTRGSVNAYKKSRVDETVAPPSDLIPEASMYQHLDPFPSP